MPITQAQIDALRDKNLAIDADRKATVAELDNADALLAQLAAVGAAKTHKATIIMGDTRAVAMFDSVELKAAINGALTKAHASLTGTLDKWTKVP